MPRKKVVKKKEPEQNEMFSGNPIYQLPHIKQDYYVFDKFTAYSNGIVAATIMAFIRSVVIWKKRYNVDFYEDHYWVRESEIFQYMSFIPILEIKPGLDRLSQTILTKTFVRADGSVLNLYSIEYNF